MIGTKTFEQLVENVTKGSSDISTWFRLALIYQSHKKFFTLSDLVASCGSNPPEGPTLLNQIDTLLTAGGFEYVPDGSSGWCYEDEFDFASQCCYAKVIEMSPRSNEAFQAWSMLERSLFSYCGPSDQRRDRDFKKLQAIAKRSLLDQLYPVLSDTRHPSNAQVQMICFNLFYQISRILVDAIDDLVIAYIQNRIQGNDCKDEGQNIRYKINCYILVNNNFGLIRSYSDDPSVKKETVLKKLLAKKSSHLNDVKVLLEEALDSSTVLGRYFYLQRGAYKTKLSRGTLSTIQKEIQLIELALSPEPTESRSFLAGMFAKKLSDEVSNPSAEDTLQEDLGKLRFL